jgi:hypothetical protein
LFWSAAPFQLVDSAEQGFCKFADWRETEIETWCLFKLAGFGMKRFSQIYGGENLHGSSWHGF